MRITTWYGDYVDGVQFTYMVDGQKMRGRHHGRLGDNYLNLELEENEGATPAWQLLSAGSHGGAPARRADPMQVRCSHQCWTSSTRTSGCWVLVAQIEDTTLISPDSPIVLQGHLEARAAS